MAYHLWTHIALAVRQLQQAEKFYARLFGLAVTFRETETANGWRTLRGGAVAAGIGARPLHGAVDLPDTTWHDRPGIDHRKHLKVATDQSAAPGLLAGTGIAAAQPAVQQLASRHHAEPASQPCGQRDR